MELVYLWVEEYKNIHKQGFNFSPRFKCEFFPEYEEYTDRHEDKKERLKDNCELKICDKKGELAPKCEENDYIENYYGQNISVTVIVGKNGSGKSSVIKLLLKNSLHNSFLLYYDLSSNEFLTMGEVKPKNFNNKLKPFMVKNIFYSNHTFDIEKYLPSIDYTYDEMRTVNDKSISTCSLVEQNLNDLYKENPHIVNNTFQYCLDIKQALSSNIYYKYILSNDIENMVDLLKKNNLKLPFQLSSIKIYLNKYSQKLTSTKFLKSLIENNTDEKILEAAYPITYSTNRLNNIQHIKRAIICTFLDDYILARKNNEWGAFFYRKAKNILWIKKIKDINELYAVFKYYFYIFQKYDIEIFNTFSDYFSKADKFLITCKSLFERENSIYEIIQINDIEKDFVRQYHKFKTPDNSFLHFSSISTLSDGEKKYSEVFTRLFNAIINIDEESIWVLVDEGEVSLHPEWQKKYIEYLTQFFVDNFKNKKVHLIITTHSPFILSDIPKQNIIFLDKNEDGNCKVVDSLNEKKQTFGANIHTLLSDSFFMEDGLMGEFAKGKIEKIKKFYQVVAKYKTKKKLHGRMKNKLGECFNKKRVEFQNIHSIIGEPFLKTIIGNYLDELEQIFDNDQYAQKQKKKLLKQFSKEDLEEYIKGLDNV